MREKRIAAPVPVPRLVEHDVEQDALATLPDWWRQIDRWMNEGGADARSAAGQDKPGSPARRRESA